MESSLGTVKGQMILDVKQALASYTAARAAHVSTVTALSTGAGALTSVGQGMALAGAGLAVGIGVAVNAAAEFERKLDYFGAVSNSTQEEYDAIRKKALELGKDTIYSAGEIADSFVELGKAGVSAKDIIGGVGEGVAALGAAADIPLDTAATIITSAVQSFGLGADKAVEVADRLAGAANASILDVQDLGVSLKYVGGVASALGIEFEDVNTALAILGKYGIRGSTAGTSLRQTLVSLGGATKKAETELKSLGIITEDGSNQFFNTDGSAKTLAETFDILGKATAGMTDQAKLASFKKIFQVRALPTVIALTKEGAAGFDQMAASINKTTAAEVAAKRLDNLSGDIEVLKGNIETLAIEAGSQLQVFARGVVQGLTKVIQFFSELSPEMQKTIIVTLAWIAGILIVVGVIGMFAGAVLHIIALIIQLGPVLTLVGKGIGILATGFRALGAAMLANPIGIIIALIGVLIAIFIHLWNNNEGFRQFWINLWETIKSAALAVWNWLKGLPAFFGTMWASIQATTQTIWNNILNFFRAIPGAIMTFFLNFTLPGLLIKHWDSIWGAIQTAWGAIMTFFQELPGNLANFFAELPSKVGYFIGLMAGTALRFLIDFTVNSVNAIRNWFNQTVSWFQKLPGRVTSFVTKLYDSVINWLTKLSVQAIIWVIKAYRGITDWFEKLPGRVATFFTNVYNNVINWMAKTGTKAVAQALSMITGIQRWWAALPGKVAAWFRDTYNSVVTWFRKASTAGSNLARDMYNGIVNFVSDIPGAVAGAFRQVYNTVIGWVSSGYQAAVNFGSSLWEGFKDGMGIHSPSYIEEAMFKVVDTMDAETSKFRTQVRDLQGLGNHLTEIGNTLSFGDGLNVDQIAKEISSAQAYQAQLASLAASTNFGTSLGVTSTETVTLDSIDRTLRLLATRPQKVVNQEVEINNPVTARDSESTDQGLQLAGAVLE